MDPISALIGAGGSLLGGLFNKPPSAWKQSYQGIMGQAQGSRDAAEQYGFNPLTLLGVSSPLGAGSGPGMGAAISDAMALLADGFSRRSDVGQKEALQRENTTLRERLTKQTLQPEVAGVYDRVQATGANNAGQTAGSVSQAVPAGGNPAGGGRADSGGWRPLAETLGVDPRRSVDHEPNRTHSGWMTIDSPFLRGPVHMPTLDGDEVLQWYDYPSLLPMVPQIAVQEYNHWFQRDLQRRYERREEAPPGLLDTFLGGSPPLAASRMNRPPPRARRPASGRMTSPPPPAPRSRSRPRASPNAGGGMIPYGFFTDLYGPQ